MDTDCGFLVLSTGVSSIIISPTSAFLSKVKSSSLWFPASVQIGSPHQQKVFNWHVNESSAVAGSGGYFQWILQTEGEEGGLCLSC